MGNKPSIIRPNATFIPMPRQSAEVIGKQEGTPKKKDRKGQKKKLPKRRK